MISENIVRILPSGTLIIFLQSHHKLLPDSLDILVSLEKLLDMKSSEPWSYHRLPTFTATFPAIINSEDEDNENDLLRTRDHGTNKSSLKNGVVQKSKSFLQPYDIAKEGISKQVRALRKKLQQIELLEEKMVKGHPFDDQQVAKLQMRSALQSSLSELGVPTETVKTKAYSFVDEKESRKGASRKQRKKSKQKAAQKDEEPNNNDTSAESDLIKAFLDIEVSQVANKEKDAHMKSAEASQEIKISQFCNKNTIADVPKNKTGSTASSKKQNKKGGLSMFLSGALDDIPKSVAPPPMIPKIEGPAWDGAKISKGSTTLREIQDEQSKTRARTPPSLSCPSLRNIQLQQRKQHQGISHSPKTRTIGFSVMSGQGSPSESGVVNRWFKPETDAPSSIRSIQIEERAMKDLKRFHSSVKIVNNQS
ncbi:Macro domain-containing protein XCC3184 [Olea europaea subsp. europaea]|uniref:Macro domain-containing protein XCC3184 n=1 Tax=Olea europaea subsp. europaea TaxID=158383 RepID=A0A8S0UWL9_OLEEU|nr:Macro domain-containing protein XCC3184 [Olea europaea subsp. europaea]